jgi:pilus assembly protein CpaB
MLRILILLIALGAGGGAAWIATQQTPAPEPPTADAVPQEPAAPPIEMTSVLVAAQDISRSGEITSEGVRWQDWPTESVPAGSIDRNADSRGLTNATGQYATRHIMAGEPIGNHLLAPTPGSYLAAMLAPDKRAVAISANTQSTAGGFILPNDRVDVLYTGQASGDDMRARTILRGVRVLAIDQSTDHAEANTVLGKTATLELTEDQAEVVTAAQSRGTLSLSLRPMVEIPGEASMEIMTPPKQVRIGRGTSIEDITLN